MHEDPSTVGLPTRHHQHHANRLHETNRRVTRRSRVQARKSVSFAAGVSARAIQPESAHQADDCQHVDEVGTGASRDADSVLFGLDWSDDTVSTINSVTDRNDKTRGGKELLAFVDSGAVDNVLPSQCVLSILWRRFPSRGVEMVSKERTGHSSSTLGSDVFESRQVLAAT